MHQVPLPLDKVQPVGGRPSTAATNSRTRSTRGSGVDRTASTLLPLYDPEHACQLLGIRRSKLWDEMRLGRLGYVKVGALTRFTPRHLEDYVRLLLEETARRR